MSAELDFRKTSAWMSDEHKMLADMTDAELEDRKR